MLYEQCIMMIKYACNAYSYVDKMITNVPELMRTARGDRNQKDFATLLGVKQSSISRYERGKASPPAAVIEHCMHLVHESTNGAAPTADDLAKRIRIVLADPAMAPVRAAFSGLLDAVVGANSNYHDHTVTSALR